MGEYLPFARYTSEFVGTFILVFTFGCNAITHSGTFAGISIGCVLMVMVYSLGKSSGAHFNPAVTCACLRMEKIDVVEALIYVVVQNVAAATAGVCYSIFLGKAIKLQPTEGHTWLAAGMCELLYTFMLCFVVLNTAASKAHAGKNQFYGLAIGFVIIAGAYSGGVLSMGCFNPAIAFGVSISNAQTLTDLIYCFEYTSFEVLGAILASTLFCVCRPEELERDQPTATRPPGTLEKLTSEFVGTYILVLTVGLNVLNGSSAAAFSVAASLTCMIFALGSVSGAHFNPAVTTAIFCAGHTDLSVMDAVGYIITQIVAGVSAAFTYAAIMGRRTFELKPAEYTLAQACSAELVFTFVLAFVVLSVATVKSPLSEYFGLAIGMCVTVGGLAVGAVSGASLNPAVSIGVYTSATVLGNSAFWQCLVYSFVELVAGVLAAYVFQVTQPSEMKKRSPFNLMGIADYGTA